MGSGAGKAQKPAQGADRPGGPGSASWRRRRRLLFGILDPGPFESTPVRQQYSEIPQEGDFVFGRFPGGLAEADGMRRLCNERKYDHDEGYLRVDALELLGLGLMSTQPLTRRLHKLAQVSHILPGPRRPLLTCYELLALLSVLRAGSKEELLELLFCVFDADGDDQVSTEDLASTIQAFLQLQEATANFDQGELKAFKKLDVKKKRAEALRIAQSAIKEYGREEGDEVEPQTGNEGTEEKAGEEKKEEEEEPAAPTTPEVPMTPQGSPTESGSGRPPGGSPAESGSAGTGAGKAEDDDSDDDDALLQMNRSASWRTHVSQASKVPQDGDAKKPKAKKKGGGLCSGKPPKDSDEPGTDAASKASQPEAKEGTESEEAPKPPKPPKPPKEGEEAETSDDDDDLPFALAKAKAKAKVKAKRRGLCGSAPKEDASASEAETAKKEKEAEKKESEAKAKTEAEAKEKEKKEAEAKAKAKAKAKPKAKAKTKAGSSCLGFGGKRPEKKLSFQQWQRWLLELQMLPLGLEEAAALGAASPPAPEHQFDLPTGYPDKPAGNRADDEIGPAPLPPPAALAKGISERTSTETSESEGGSPDLRRQMARPLLAS